MYKRGKKVNREYQIIDDATQIEFNHLIDTYKSVVERLSFQFGVDPNDIEAVVKTVFTKIVKGSYKEKVDFEPLWIYQTTYQTIKAYSRKQKKKSGMPEMVSKKQQLGYYFEKKEHMVMHSILREMSINHKAPLIFYYFHNLTMEEISRIIKSNEEHVDSKIERSKKTILKRYGKAEESTFVTLDEMKLEKQFSEMKYVYDLLPEFSNAHDVLLYIEFKQNKLSWKRRLPTVMAIVGLFFFASVAIFYLQEEKKEIALEKEKEAVQQEKQNQVITDVVEKKNRIDQEILVYLYEMKKNFALEIGLNDASSFPSVVSVDGYIEEMKQFPENYGESLEDVKDIIDYFLTPPSKRKRELDASGENGDESLLQLLYSYRFYKVQFQDYLNQLLTKYQIKMDDYDAIVKAQKDRDSYEGPEEIRLLLRILDEQGYILTRDTEYLTVQIDYKYVKEITKEAGFDEGYMEYVSFMEHAQDVNSTTVWQELDTDLIRLEKIIKEHGNDFSNLFRNALVQELNSSLFIYLTGSGERPHEEGKNEFYQFLEKHPDSILFAVVKEAVTDWEANDWISTYFYPDYNRMEVIFDPRFHHVAYSDIYDLHNWPIVEGTSDLYEEYEENLDQGLLQGLRPIDILSLYIYADQKTDKTVFTSLHDLFEKLDNDALDWWKLKGESQLIAVQQLSEGQATIYFLSWHLNEKQIITSINMEKVNGVWQINRIE
jgi:RNA polymerase sigma-70 factor, ECF subfamily